MSSRVPSPEALAALAALRARFRASLEPTLSSFERHADALRAAPDAVEELDALQRALHRVRGTAGSYGFHEASSLCAAHEARVREWIADAACERDARALVTGRFAAALRRAFDERDGAGA